MLEPELGFLPLPAFLGDGVVGVLELPGQVGDGGAGGGGLQLGLHQRGQVGGHLVEQLGVVAVGRRSCRGGDGGDGLLRDRTVGRGEHRSGEHEPQRHGDGFLAKQLPGELLAGGNPGGGADQGVEAGVAHARSSNAARM